MSGAWLEQFGPAPKRYRHGTHRASSPGGTVAVFEPRKAEFGITRLADVTGLDTIGIPVYMAVRPNARSLSVAQGKGIDRDAAKASALMEAIESWHAERVRLPLRYESYAALSRAAHVIDIARLPRRRGAVIDPASPTLWVEGHDIMTSAEVMVPLECVSTYFVQPTRLGNTFVQDSNGLASGNHILEATVHGLCEVLERDACARWELAGGMNLDDRRVDLSTIPDPDVSHVLDRLDHAGIAVGVWDVTSGTGVPAFMCVIVDEPGAPRWSFQGMFAGAGCHLNATVAVLRALTEAVQSRLTQITGVRDDMTSHSGLADPAEVRAVAAMLKRADGVRFLETDLSAAAFEDDLRTLLARVSKSGLDSVVVVDLSQPEVGIPVVRVIVPGLESSCDQQAPTPGARSRTTAAA